VGESLLQMQAIYIGIAVICIVLAVVVSAIKWQFLLMGQDIHIRRSDLYNVYWIGLFFNNLLPSSIGGDAIRIALISRQIGQPAAAAASVVMERLIATLALAVVGFAASFFVAVPLLYVQAAFGILLFLTIILLYFMLSGSEPVLFARYNNNIRKLVQEFLGAGEKLRHRPKLLYCCFIWSMVFQCINVAVNYALMQGLNLAQIGVWDALFVVPATSVLAMIPLGINGYGLREGGYVALLAVYGVDSARAFSVSIVFAFLVSTCSLWGGLLWLRTAKKEQGTW
jgi:glycosyltransferase 2 family protein